MLSVPAGRLGTVMETVPLFRVPEPEPMAAPLSYNCTVPVAAPGATLTLNVIGVPVEMALGEVVLKVLVVAVVPVELEMVIVSGFDALEL